MGIFTRKKTPGERISDAFKGDFKSTKLDGGKVAKQAGAGGALLVMAAALLIEAAEKASRALVVAVRKKGDDK